MMAHLGTTQVSIMRSTVDRWFDCTGRDGLYRTCMRLHARGLLARDKISRWRFTATEAGRQAIIEHDAELG